MIDDLVGLTDAGVSSPVLSLLQTCILRYPGKSELSGSSLALKLSPAPGVARVAFEFAEPQFLGPFTHISFRLSEIDAGSISASLIHGDVGLPEIRFVSDEGAVWRFKRGNHKDFFDLSRPGQVQTISLPLRFFIYDTDTKTNVPGTVPFTVSKVKSIFMDFMPSKTVPISVMLADVTLLSTPMEKQPIRIFDVARLMGTTRSNSISPFYTNDGIIGIALVFDQRIFEPMLHEAVIRIEKYDQGERLVDATEQPISALRTHVTIRLAQRGFFTLRMSIVHNGSVVAAQTVGCGYGVDSDQVRSSILGISDDGFEDEIGLMGGRFQRRVAGYRGVLAPTDGSPFRWLGRTSPLPTSRPVPLQDVIISMKAMPDFLSRKKGSVDSYRYGPSDLDAFAKIVAFVANEMSRSGFFFLEPWNEASVRHEWNDDLDTLMDLYRVVYETVKRVDPRIQVLPGTTHTFDFDFIEKLLCAGVGRYMDGLAIHGYTYQPRRLAADMARTPELLRQYAGQFGNPSNLGDMPVFLTEIGFRMPAFSARDQAKWFATASLLASCHANYQAILWFRQQNRYDGNLEEYDQNQSTGYAMVEYLKRGIRPSLLAYRMTASFLSLYPRGVLESERSEEQLVFRFAAGDGKGEAGVIVADTVATTVPAGMIALDVGGRLLGRQGANIQTGFAPVYLIPAADERKVTENRPS